MRTVALLLCTLALAVGQPARADQCAWNTARRVVTRAERLVAETHHLVHLCAPCGETQGIIAPIETVRTRVERALGRRFHVLVVNGEDVDLAYVYVPAGPHRWENLGLRVGCGATDVPPTYDEASSGDQPPSPSTSDSANGVSG
jgi:hypothetical protein